MLPGGHIIPDQDQAEGGPVGFIKDSKASTLAGDARRARTEGKTVFVAQLRGPLSHTAALTRVIPDAAEMIQAIEAEGWYLDKMNGIDHKNNTTLFVLFRPTTYQTQPQAGHP